MMKTGIGSEEQTSADSTADFKAGQNCRRRLLRGNLVEALEQRQLLSVTLNSAGFSVFTPDSNSISVYVSASTGSDSNTGLSSSKPVASLAKAYSLLRGGHDDQLLLKRGDIWGTTFGQWQLSGVSQQLPMFIGTYGSGNRPVINCGSGDGFDVYKNPVNFILMQGIVFNDNLRDPTQTTVTTTAAAAASSGFLLLQPSTGFTIEDCSFTYFDNNVSLQNQNTSAGVITNLTLRRSLIADAYCTGSTHAQGLYAAVTSGITLDQDVFDNNGWNAAVSGAGMTGYNHNIYGVSTALGFIITNCIIADASATGVLSRGGGVIDGNLFLNNAVGISFGEGDGATSTPGGVTGEINNNVFMDNHPEGTTRIGQGIDIGNIRPGSGVTVSGNIFADDDEQASAAITLDFASGTTNPLSCVGINDLTVSNNITYGWIDGLQIAAFDDSSSLKTLSNVTITANQFQSDPLFMVNHQGAYLAGQEHWSSNVYYSTYGAPFHLLNTYPTNAAWLGVDPSAIFQQQAYAAPTRTPATYNAAMGGASTLSAFMAVENSQSDLSWNLAYTAPAVLGYLRAGFAAGLNVAAGQTFTIPYNSTGHTVDAITGLTIAGATNAWTGTVDVTDNAMDIAGASLATVTNQARQGYANGTWTGLGITSSTAASAAFKLTGVGVVQNNQGGVPLFGASNLFDGTAPGGSDILVKYTYYGDANLSGIVDSADYALIDAGYLSHGSLAGWYNGDFNYDGVINGSDYTLIDNAFNQQGATLASQIAEKASVPKGAAFSAEPIAVASSGSSDQFNANQQRPATAASQIFGDVPLDRKNRTALVFERIANGVRAHR